MQDEQRIKRLIESRKYKGRTTRSQTKNNSEKNMETEQTIPVQENREGCIAEDLRVVLELVDLENRFPSHAVHVGRLLRETGITNITDITKVGLFRFVVTAGTKRESDRIRNAKLEHQNLKIYNPRPKDQTICFVKGVPHSFEEDEIKDTAETEVEVLKVERLKKRGRDNKLHDTENIRVTVQGPNVPERIRIYGCCFRAERYIFPVRQCRQCWRFGHGPKSCRSRPRCRKCGGRHLEEECGEQPKCVNCGMNHDAQAKDCPERVRRWSILDRMKKGATYQEAEGFFPKLTNRFAELATVDDEYDEINEAAGPGNGNSTGTHPGRGRQRRSRTPRRSVEREEERNQPKTTTPMTGNCENRRAPDRSFSNPHATSEFERFMEKLKKDFLAETTARRWIDPLKTLHSRIVVGVNEANNVIESDRLLIEIAQSILDLINTNTGVLQQGHVSPRTDEDSHSVV